MTSAVLGPVAVPRRTPWRAAVATVRPYRAAVLVAGAVVALAAWLGPRLLLGPLVPVTAVVQRDFVKSVVASGHVEAPHRVTIGAQIVGVVQRVPVAEGQSVFAGQALVELERSEALAAAAADLAVTQAQARLRQLREVQAPVAEQAVRQARINVDNARRQRDRQADLFRQGFIGQAALELWLRYARNADGTPLFALVMEPGLFVAAVVLATATGLAAAFAPALRAARLDPVVAIRG